jgi:hypothetical protein
MLCKQCQTLITRKLDPRVKNHFCCRSCAAIYNNKLKPKRTKITYHCSECGSKVFHKETKRCKKCQQGIATTDVVKQTTVGQIKELYRDKNKLAIAAKIRGYGKTVYNKSNKPKQCINCGYSKHYEVCHIKSIASFDDNATMAEVHSLDNLIALCPNCHWEYDHGLLELK